MSRLPTPGSDDGTWGDILNEFLSQEHNADGSQKDIPQSKVTNLLSDLATKVTKGELVHNIVDDGADPTGATDSTAAINIALARGGITWCPPGTYLISPISLPSSANLMGAGSSQTTLQFNNPTTQTFMYATGSFSGSSTTLTADVAAGTMTVSVSSSSGFTVGQWLLIGDNTVPDSNYPTRKSGEMLRISSLTSTTVSFYSQLAFSYSTGNSAFLRALTSPKTGIRISDIRFVNPSPGTTTASGIAFTSCVDIQVSNLRLEGLDNPGITFDSCASFGVSRVSMEDFSSDDGNSRYGYGINLNGACTAGEISDSRFVNVRHAVTTNGSVSYGEATDITVTGCHAIACKLAAFDTHGGASNISFVGCVVRGGNTTNTPPAFQIRGRKVSLIGCRAYGISGSTVYASVNPQYMTIIGCEFRDGVGSQSNGIFLDGDITGAMIKNNIIDGITQHGIFFTSSCSGSGVAVEGNYIKNFGTSAGYYAIYIDGAVSFPIIRNNTFQTGYAGVIATVNTARSLVHDNTGISLTASGSWLSVAGNSQFTRNRLMNVQLSNTTIDSVTLSSTGTVTWNSGISNYHRVTLGANATASVINNPAIVEESAIITIEIIQDATGGRTFAFPISLMKWAGGSAPTLSTTANYRDIFQFSYQSSTGSYLEISRSLGVR